LAPALRRSLGMPHIHGPQLQKIVAEYALTHGHQSPQELAFGVMKHIQSNQGKVIFGDILVAMDTLSELAANQEKLGRESAPKLGHTTALTPVKTAPVSSSGSLLGLQMKELSTVGERVDLGGDRQMKDTLRMTQRLFHRAMSMRETQRSSGPVKTGSTPRLPPVGLPVDGMGLLNALAKQPRIRVYVETGSNKGHQSASVTMAKKLVERFSVQSKTPCTIEFCCNDRDAAEKVRSILGGSDIRGFPCEIKVLGEDSLKKVDYAISGAIDDPDKKFPKLKTKHLIALQPLGWSGGAEVVMSQGDYTGGPKKVVLTRGAGLFSDPVNPAFTPPVPFHRMPFTEPTGSIQPFKPTKAPDVIVSQLMDSARDSQGKPGSFSICPLYGMGAGQPMENYGSKVWINTTRALLELAGTEGFKDNVVLTNLSLDMGSDPKKTWGEVKAAFAKDPRVAVLDTPLTHPDHAQLVQEALRNGAKVVICSVTGGKDYRVMDRAYRESRLPPIFEGQGSLTQVISMGRPFIKLSSRASVDKSWPSDYLPAPSFKGIDEGIQRTSNSIIEDWSRSSGHPERALAQTMLEMTRDDSEVSQYFRQCRDMVTHPGYDRLSWAAQALAHIDELAPHQESGK
jgi:hypothetical protein